MYPANQYMDPYYSHYRNHAPYPYYYPPGWEASHPRPMDSSHRPLSYGPWPYSSGMHHPHPSELHCCCNHMYPPGYHSFRPPFPQELPPPHLYYHGPFMPHPNEFPHFVRPQSYPVEQIPNDYSNKFKSHCCGCPNHVCHGGEKSNVKIEEERPEGKPSREWQDGDNSSIVSRPNNQYPVIWLPPGKNGDKENGRYYELPPQLLNGWSPVHGNRAGDVKQQEQDDQKEKQFQWPIFWMPVGYGERKQKDKELKEINESPKISEESPSPKIKIIPLSSFDNGHQDQKLAAKDGSEDHSDRSVVKSQPARTECHDGMAVEGHHKTTPSVSKRVNDEMKPARVNYKTIPVVRDKEPDEKVSTCRTIPVKSLNESEKMPGMSEKKEVKSPGNVEKEAENGKTNQGESSVAKHKKLPPVCLRVDPLPRKKLGNGSSRSPSPPTRKDADKTNKDMKEAQSQNLDPKHSDTKKHVTASEVKEKSPDETKEGVGFNNETVQAASAKHPQEEEVSTSKDDQKVQASSTDAGTQGNADAKSLQGDTHEIVGPESSLGGYKSKEEDVLMIPSECKKDDAKTLRSNLSEEDAAIRIQSAYRGYDARKWQPLDKLRKIRDVHDQMQGVRKQLQCLEASSNRPTEKEQVAIGETIMNLLLKLDTIQGLLPSVREARKSTARELICLQEKLDNLCKRLSHEFSHTNSATKDPESAQGGTQIAAATVTAEASEEKATQLDAAQESPSVDSTELEDVAPSRVLVEPRQDAGSTEQRHQMGDLNKTTLEGVPDDEGKQAEFQGTSSTNLISDAALPGKSTDNKQHIEESNVILMQQLSEKEKPTMQGEGQEVPLVESMEPLHDVASSGNPDTEDSNTGVSPGVNEDIKATAEVASVESREEVEKDGPVENQILDATVERMEEQRNLDVSPAEDQREGSSAPVVHLEDSSVPLKDAEPHEDDLNPVNESVIADSVDEPEEARDIEIKERDADSMQDSTKQQDGTPEASLDYLVASAGSENAVQALPLEPTSDSNEQSTLEESDDAVQCEVSGKDDSGHEDHTIEPIVDKLEDTLANKDEPPVLEASRLEPDVQGSHPNLAEEADTARAETVLPELDSCEPSCMQDAAITGSERHDMEVSPESQTETQEEGVYSSPADVWISETNECKGTKKEVPNPAEEVDVQVSEADVYNVNVMQEDALHTAGTGSTEREADTPKEDISVQTENKASEETCPASATPETLKASEEKRLAEENQKLKEMLQKLLASGNDQMGVITDLSQKVEALERKLARRKRPRVRTHRPSRHAMATVH